MKDSCVNLGVGYRSVFADIIPIITETGGSKMKRITSACLEQTIRFDTYNDANPKEDLKRFLELMDRKNTKYQIVDQMENSDGSVIIKIKKQYNAYKTDGYID